VEIIRFVCKISIFGRLCVTMTSFLNRYFMEVQFFFKNVPESIHHEIKAYFEKKRVRIERFLKHFSRDSVIMYVNVETFAKKDACAVEFVLSIPHHRLVAKEESHLYTKAIDDAKDRLISQIKEVKERSQDKTKKKVLHKMV